MSLNGEISNKRLNLAKIIVIRIVGYPNHRWTLKLPHTFHVMKNPDVKYKTFCSFFFYQTVLVPRFCEMKSSFFFLVWLKFFRQSLLLSIVILSGMEVIPSGKIFDKSTSRKNSFMIFEIERFNYGSISLTQLLARGDLISSKKRNTSFSRFFLLILLRRPVISKYCLLEYCSSLCCCLSRSTCILLVFW